MILNPGDHQDVVASATDAGSSAVTRPLSFSWSSSDMSVMVTPDSGDSSKARITRIGPGPTATITATAEAQSGTATIR